MKKPSHRTGLAFILNFLVTPRHFSFHFLALFLDAVLGVSPAKIHATSVLASSIVKPWLLKEVWT
jgi:hypothetical protein